ncbi:MAG: hypothetical protein Q7U54_10065 [Bacteroidales bacterium]|nr:hypothetical protein [Bacteroidales bacterium]
MKKSFLLIFCSVFTFYSYAQKSESRKGKIGITFSSFGENDVIRAEPLMGEASYNSDQFYIFGICYTYKLNNTFDFETGVEYAKHKIIIDPFDPPYDAAPSHGARFSLVNIPITVRVNFLKYCFVNGGLNLDFDPTVSSPVDSQDGIGAIFGFGLKYESKSGISAFVNPYFKAHSLVSFSPFENRQRVMESGFRFGIMYNLK